jgi:hypothetical protein
LVHLANCKRFACPADPSCACACSPEGSARSAPQEALEASKREPRRRQNPTPRGPKASPEGSGSLLGARSAPDGLQGCSETAFGRLLGRSWGALGVVLGSSWELLGRSRPLLGRSWGSFWPPGGDFFAVFGWLFWRLGPGPRENSFFDVFVVFFECCVAFFLSLSCLPRGAPGRNANIENSLKHSGFYDEFAWVAFLRQVQREQISEHRHTQNYKKNTCKHSRRDVSTNH